MKVCLVFLWLALLRPEGRVRPASAGCSSPEALRMAEEALEQLNLDLSDGYILSLNRLYDISHTPERVRANTHSTKCILLNEMTAVFSREVRFSTKLSLDVIKTKCHISSRNPWKQCEVRSIGDIPVSSTSGISPSPDTDSILLQSKN